MVLSAQNITAGVVIAHGLGALIKHFLHTPAQKAQVDAIEAKLDAVAGQVSTLATKS